MSIYDSENLSRGYTLDPVKQGEEGVWEERREGYMGRERR
jgi:hypothetical protein